MDFLRITGKDFISKYWIYIIYGCLGGICSSLLIIQINEQVKSAIAGKPAENSRIILYVLLLVAYFFFNRIFLGKMVRIAQASIQSLRMEILNMVNTSGYMEAMKKKDEIYTVLSGDISILASSYMYMVQVLTGLVTILICFGYMAYLSLSLFAITLLVLMTSCMIYYIVQKKGRTFFQAGRSNEGEFMGQLHAVFNGMKEIMMNRNRGDELINVYMKDTCQRSSENYRKGYNYYYNSSMVAEIMIYVYLSIFIMFVPVFNGQVYFLNYVFIILYLLGPVRNIMNTIPVLQLANISARELLAVKDALANPVTPSVIKEFPVEFESLVFSGATFTYPEDNGVPGFGIGPVDFCMNKGEVIFLYGQNGNGKTSFINLLLGLLPLKSGSVYLNGENVTNSSREFYTRLFSPVFSDFYLFNRFYGMKDVDITQAQGYLRLFEMDDKVSVTASGFSDTRLSTGQRKRLALINALLENRPVLVLDEWAADQDPFFRAKFYEEILPVLKREGRTILAITHDNRYFDRCERLLQMDYGKITERQLSRK